MLISKTYIFFIIESCFVKDIKQIKILLYQKQIKIFDNPILE